MPTQETINLFALQRAYGEHCINPRIHEVRFTSTFAKPHFVQAMDTVLSQTTTMKWHYPKAHDCVQTFGKIMTADVGDYVAVYAYQQHERVLTYTIMQTHFPVPPHEVATGNAGLTAYVNNAIRCTYDATEGVAITPNFTGYPLPENHPRSSMYGSKEHVDYLLSRMLIPEQQHVLYLLFQAISIAETQINKQNDQ